MALSILPYLLTTAVKKENEEAKICILTATSGDTGKAALEGFADVPGTEIIVFFPDKGVSEVQKRQMVSQEGANTHVFAIRGNFDDAQTGVKKIFNDDAFADKLAKAGCKLSSANSINIGRLVPQVAYYVYGYAKLIEQGEIKNGDLINVVFLRETSETFSRRTTQSRWECRSTGLSAHPIKTRCSQTS